MGADYPELRLATQPISLVAELRRRFGVVLLRDFFTRDELAGLRFLGNFAYGIGEAIRELSDEERVPEFLRIGLRGHGWIPWVNVTAWLDGFGIADGPVLSRLLARVREVASAAYSGADTRLLDQVSTFRRHRKGPLSAQVPWHRDSAVVKTSPFGQATNVWIPLVDVGVDSPSLELVLGSHHIMEPIPEPPEPELENLTDEWVARNLAGLTHWLPDCRAGDILLFDHNVVHRTQPLPEARIERMSIELRWSPVAAERT